ncbi:MAG: glycosyltransferase family 1 protein [Acidobacteriaceae bacterium]
MRILHVVGSLNCGGAENWIMDVLRHIDRQSFQFDFLVHHHGPSHFHAEAESLGARVIPCLSPSSPLRYGKNFLRILREYGPYDCVHSHVHHFTGYVMLLSRFAGVPLRIAHSHTGHKETGIPIARRNYLRAMEFLVRRFATRGIAVSGVAGDSLFHKNWRSDAKWSIQPNGIDVDRFRAVGNRAAAPASLGIPQTAFVVGHVGRFVEAKNHRFFIEIAQQLSRLQPHAHYLLVGDGPLRKEIEIAVAHKGLAGKFTFAGVRSDVPSLLGCMDVFLFPSQYEGLPLALLEAQAAGIPCVISDRISPEADAGIGGVYELALSEPSQSWARKMLCFHQNCCRAKDISPSIRSIDQSAIQLIRTYLTVDDKMRGCAQS